jgi:branched-chain amino acid transport system ATP-binding protein
MGLKAPSSGAIVFEGTNLDDVPTSARVHRGIVLVPEGRQVFPKFTVTENLLMGAYHRADRNALDADFTTLFAMFPRLAERRRQAAGSMSGGEQQMLAIARGLMAKPRCLLLDEPTLGLAPIIVQEIGAIIRRLAANGLTVLLAEQNAAMALAVADRGYVLETGRVSLEGTGADLAGNEAVRRNYLGT